MQNSERDQFEQSWKSAFDGSEMAPPDRLWNSVEANLAGDETAVMKRRVVFYQRLAAATVLFALLSGAYAVYTYRGGSPEIASTQTHQTPGGQPPAQSQQSIVSEPKLEQSPSSTVASGNTNAAISPVANGRAADSQSKASHHQEVINESGVPLAAKDDEVSSNHELDSSPAVVESSARDGSVAALQEDSLKQQEGLTKEEPQVAKLLSADEINALAEAEDKKDKTASDHSVWLGLGGAAGSYAPNATVTSSGLMASADAIGFNSYAASQGIPQSYSESVGSAYSAGVSAGFKIAKRWVLQSGLNYINQRIDYTTNFVGVASNNKAMAMTRDYVAETSYDVMVTNPYEVSSATEMLSIPVQAGFLIIDRKFGWQISTGVSTDLLLRNTLTDKSGSRGKVSEGAGEESPYRTFNGAALLNTELSYKIGDHYRLAVVPGFRYSFKPMLKENVTGSPLVLDIGFRFKYLFN
jgi:hypothetical protein